MKEYVFHNEFKIVRNQALNVFDGLVVKRFNETDDTTVIDRIPLNIVFAPKNRVIYDMVNKNQHIKCPIMSFTTSNIQFDKSRTFNKIEGQSLNSATLSSGGRIPQPIPITFDLKASILVTYNRDLDQILTNILSHFYPYIIISYIHPNVNQEVRCKIEFDGNIALSYPSDLSSNVPYRIIADMTFTVSTWIYQNFDNISNIIHNIPITFASVSALADDYEYLHSMEYPDRTDYLTVSGRPQMSNIYPYVVDHNNDNQINLFGVMFEDIKGVIVSDINTQMYDTSAYEIFTPFISSKRLSSLYTSFTGVSVDNLTIADNKTLSFTIPKPANSGYLEVVAWSDYGVGFLTTDTYRPSGTFQFPYSNGIELF
jgi:hypothetical protein